MNNTRSLSRSRKTIAALSGSVALLLAALSPSTHAADNIYTGTFPFPVWDSGFGANWSLGVAPTAADNAIFPTNVLPTGAGVPFGFAADGKDIAVTQFISGGPVPIAANLIFQDNFILRKSPPLLAPAIPSAIGITLSVGGVSVVEGKTTLIATDILFTNPNGTLTKTGKGTLLLENQVYGNVVVSAGTLGGNFSTLGNLVNNATLSPGRSPGEVTVGKNYTQGSDGHLAIELASARAYDRVTVKGEAHLDGDLDVSLVNGYRPSKGQKFTILTAQKGVSGEFDDVTKYVWDNLTLRVYYGEDEVYLKSVINSFAALSGLTPNQHAVATVLDGVTYDERTEKLITYLYKRDFSQLPKDFDRIAPEELTSIFTISTALANVQSLNLQRRTDDLRSGASGFSAGGLAMQGTGPGYSGGLFGAAGPSGDGKESKETKTVVEDEKRWGTFLTGVGEWVDVDGDGNARGYDITTGGFTLGIDYKVTPNFALGISAGYAGTSANLSDNGRVWVNGGKLGLYGTYFTGGFYVDAAVTGGYNSYDTKRGALQGAARGSTEGGELNVLAGTGYDWKVGALTIGPTATFQYTLVGMDGYDEHGSLVPLSIGSRDIESIRSAFGLKASYDWHVGSVVIKPEIRAAWQHEFGDRNYDISASFADGAGSGFLVSGPEIGRDSLLVGAGFAVQLTDRCATYVYYDGELARDGYDRHSVSGGVRVSF